jgi:hypothetical protein
MRTNSKVFVLLVFLSAVSVYDLYRTYDLRNTFIVSQHERCVAAVQRDRAFAAWATALQSEDNRYAAQIAVTNPSESQHLIIRNQAFTTLLEARAKIAKTVCPTELQATAAASADTLNGDDDTGD